MEGATAPPYEYSIYSRYLCVFNKNYIENFLLLSWPPRVKTLVPPVLECAFIKTSLYLSLMKLALAKQIKPELMRIIETPGIGMAIGYCLMSQKVSVSGSLTSTSVPGLMESSIIFANEIVTCNISNNLSKTSRD